ncbi:hypothetical protein G9A89_020742 [Geosiphon pyriformis]|nr:hypothetical protein G9A89_020742 [Geosiphon pyriformis]
MAQNHSQSSSRQAGSPAQTVSRDRYTKLKRKAQEIQTQNERVNSELQRARKRIKSLNQEKEGLLSRLSHIKDKDPSKTKISGNSSPRLESQDISSTSTSCASSHSFEKNTKKRVDHVPSTPTSLTSSILSGKNKKAALQASSSKKAVLPPPAKNIVNTVPVKATAKIPSKGSSKPPVNTKPLKVQPLDKDQRGSYILPVQIGSILTVINLGKVIYDRKTFHNERYIFPVGYKVQRSYNSMIDPNTQTVYTCSIEDGGDGPKFVIEPEDQPDNPITAKTATGAWVTVVRAANTIRSRKHSNAASGPDYFGFTHATIRKMIQDLPNASKCKNYVLQTFEVMKTRNNGGRKRRANENGTENARASSSNVIGESLTKENDKKGNSSGSENGDVIASDANEAESSDN